MAKRKYPKRFINCATCEKIFSPRDCPSDRAGNRGKFCSKKCSSKSHIRLPQKFVCPTCKKVFPNRYGKISIYCSKKCLDKSFLGNIPWNKNRKFSQYSKENCHFWKGGKTKLLDVFKTTFEYKQWRRKVFQRDNYTCQFCKDNKGGNLQADHIKPRYIIFEENNIKTIEQALNCKELWDIKNGRTLCKKCHKTTDTYGSKAYKYKFEKSNT